MTEFQADTLRAYVGLLSKWNRVYNLTAVRDPSVMWERHIEDCLSCAAAIARYRPDTPGLRVLDVGSGGGLPGVVVAVLLPHLEVMCIDAVAKKAAFVQEVAASLRIANLKSKHGRVETIHDPFDLVTARAFASLARLVELSEHALAPKGAWLAMKGVIPLDELAELDSSKLKFHVEQLDSTGNAESRCLVWMHRR